MPPRKERGGPGRTASIKTAATPASQLDSQLSTPVAIVRQPAARRGTKPRDAATCRVSLLAPSGRRTRWWSIARCPVCGTAHLCRSVTLEGVTRTRRLPCGHWVAIVIARTLGAFA